MWTTWHCCGFEIGLLWYEWVKLSNTQSCNVWHSSHLVQLTVSRAVSDTVCALTNRPPHQSNSNTISDRYSYELTPVSCRPMIITLQTVEHNNTCYSQSLGIIHNHEAHICTIQTKDTVSARQLVQRTMLKMSWCWDQSTPTMESVPLKTKICLTQIFACF